MKINKYKNLGSGWHNESVRHQNAKLFGSAGGLYARVRYVKVRVYKFNELPKKAQEKALEDNRYFNVEGRDWYQDDYMIDINLPKELQVSDGIIFSWKDMYFDMDRSDYIQFKNLSVDDKYEDNFRKFLKIPKPLWKKLNYSFYDNGREGNTRIDFERNDRFTSPSHPDNEFTVQETEILSKSADRFDDLMKDTLNHIRKDYDYQTSDESVKESLEANDYDFTQDGKMFFKR